MYDKNAAAGETPEPYRNNTRDTCCNPVFFHRPFSQPLLLGHSISGLEPVGMGSLRRSPAPHSAALRRCRAGHDVYQPATASADSTEQDSLPFRVLQIRPSLRNSWTELRYEKQHPRLFNSTVTCSQFVARRICAVCMSRCACLVCLANQSIQSIRPRT